MRGNWTIGKRRYIEFVQPERNPNPKIYTKKLSRIRMDHLGNQEVDLGPDTQEPQYTEADLAKVGGIGPLEQRYADIVMGKYNRRRDSMLTLILCVNRVWCNGSASSKDALPLPIRLLIWEFTIGDMRRDLVTLRNDVIRSMKRKPPWWHSINTEFLAVFDMMCACFTLPSLCILADGMERDSGHSKYKTSTNYDREHHIRCRALMRQMQEKMNMHDGLLVVVEDPRPGRPGRSVRIRTSPFLYLSIIASKRVLDIERRAPEAKQQREVDAPGYLKPRTRRWNVGDPVYGWTVTYSDPGHYLEQAPAKVVARHDNGFYTVRCRCNADLESGHFHMCDPWGLVLHGTRNELMRFRSKSDHDQLMVIQNQQQYH